MSIVIEELFSEVCNLFGDTGNMRYLRHCLPDAEFVQTSMTDKPRFVDSDVNMVYLGPMTEKTQEKVIERLTTYKQRLGEMIDSGVVFLVTGNALEVFGKSIECEDGKIISGLGLVDVTAKRNMMNRFSGIVLGDYGNMEIVGFRAQFTHCTLGASAKSFVTMKKGIPMNKQNMEEGVVKNNFFGTYILGPILIMNPDFTKSLLEKLCGEPVKLAFEDEVYTAYKARVADFKDDNVGIY